ncbi:hypothetical protein ACFRKE_28200 [Kitasatospora indigofera]|uniref:hypothetical protein n=1 Tax=Kitasatospora indigofera TaxID=67307 RepID=UPI0036781792
MSSRITDLIEPLLGHEARAPRLLHGSNLAIDFGRPNEPFVGPVLQGEWHLWIAMAAWRIERSEGVVAGSEDPRPVLEPAVGMIGGRRLTGVDIRMPSLETAFDFDGLRLLVFPVHSRRDVPDPAEHWLLRTPAGDVVTAGPGSEWSIDKANTGGWH